MHKTGLIILLLVISISCGKKSEEKTPPYIIPKNKLIPLLVDYHLAQGLSNSTAFRMRTQKYPTINLSDSVLAAHGYSHAQFDSTLLYYSRHINEFNEIYEKVITELNRMQAKIEEKKVKPSDTTNKTSPKHHNLRRLIEPSKQKI
ncbi:MAG: DUF4296 domain-containing protein [Bacteroidales bacterium]|nr:DUF4296 domain-containing protein [Bacteroidales bacterium]